MYYIAYGSNLNLKKMQERCPNAKKIGSTFLEGYELEFRYYLNIKKSLGKNIPVGIFEIDEEAERDLDYYEDYPKLYYKEYLTIALGDKMINALVYIMNDGVKPIKKPSKTYLNECLEGYQDFGFDTKYLLEPYKIFE